MPPITLKHLSSGAVALIVLAVDWRYRNAEAVQRIINPPSHKPLAIEFDKGTVRQIVPPELTGRIAPTRLEGVNLRGVFRFPL